MTIPSAPGGTGDILLLETGDMVAADGRLLGVYGLTVNELPLGESLGWEKHTGAVKARGGNRGIGRPDQHGIFRFPGDLRPCRGSGNSHGNEYGNR